MIQIDFERCNACGACVDACPEGAILLKENGPQVDSVMCTTCGDCVYACPQGVIVIDEKGTAITAPSTKSEVHIDAGTPSRSVGSALAP